MQTNDNKRRYNQLLSHFSSCSLAVLYKRRPPPFESSGKSIEAFSVTKQQAAGPQVQYQIKATPQDCAFDFPLMEIGFLQVTVWNCDFTEAGGERFTKHLN